MSGFVAIFNRDGAPIDPSVLALIMKRLHYRGPDRQSTWVDGPVAMGHTLFRVTNEAANEALPLTLQGVTLTGDIRLDGREALIERFKRGGLEATLHMPDSELLLRAYLAWGHECLRDLLGQFAGVLWDGRQQRLLAFRDHLGLQSVYYAQVGKSLIISSELGAIRLHPHVSTRLNDGALADFLLFGNLQWIDKTFTAFNDIHRLSGAHLLVAETGGEVTVRRYWTLPTGQPMLRYRTEDEYLEHFRTVLKASIQDRMRLDKVVVLMSGGLDSTSIAALAQQIVREGGSSAQLTAVTTVYERIHPDNEGEFAALAAQKIGIPVQFFVGDSFTLIEPLPATAEPTEAYESGFYDAASRLISSYGRVVLYGEGADSLLRDEPLYEVLRRFSPVGALDLYRWLWRFLGHRPPLVGLLPALNPKNWGKAHIEPAYEFPEWLNPDFVAALNLRDRWMQGWEGKMTTSHKLHAMAYSTLVAPDWATDTEMWEPLELCPPHTMMPFLDLRVVDFMLALPPLPWFKRKYLIRRAMRDDLPKEVLERPKTPLGTLLTSLLRLPGAEWVEHWHAQPELGRYVRREAVGRIIGEGPGKAYVNMRPLLLNNWLHLVHEKAVAGRRENR
jgi:asparagine synthase (glutamine-hydrolysing)